MHPLAPVVRFLKKIRVTGKIWEKAGVKVSDLTGESVNFSAFATSNIKLLLFFSEVHQRKTQENNNTLVKRFPILSPNFYPRIYGDCNPYIMCNDVNSIF